MTARRDPAREAAIRSFLARHGLGAAGREPLAGDASARRYERVRLDGETLILMDDPPPSAAAAFVRMAAWLRAAGHGAPATIAAEPDAGFLLLEDLGDDLLGRRFDRGDRDLDPFEAAVDLLLDLHRRSPPADLPVLDDGLLVERATFLPEWQAPLVLGRPLDREALDAYRALWHDLLPAVRIGRPVVILWDFMADNLVLRPGPAGAVRLGLLDFQDARAGPSAYDLVSLIEDARRDFPDEWRGRLLGRYLDGRPDLDPDAFRRSFTVLAAHHACRLLGQFVRLAAQGKPGYLRHLPRLWRRLDRLRPEPSLAPLTAWLDRHFPPAARTAPPPG